MLHKSSSWLYFDLPSSPDDLLLLTDPVSSFRTFLSTLVGSFHAFVIILDSNDNFYTVGPRTTISSLTDVSHLNQVLSFNLNNLFLRYGFDSFKHMYFKYRPINNLLPLVNSSVPVVPSVPFPTEPKFYITDMGPLFTAPHSYFF